MLFSDRYEGNQIGESRVGEDDVEASLFFADLRENPVKVRELGDVDLDGCDVRTGGGHRGIKVRLPPAGDVDIGAFFDELPCRGKTDAGTASSDEGNLTFEFLGHCLFSVGAWVETSLRADARITSQIGCN